VPLGGRGWSGHVVGTPGEPGRTLVVGSSIAPLAGGSPAQGTVPGLVSWNPSANALAAQYELQMSTNGGAVAGTPLQPGADTQVTLPLALNAGGMALTYQFRVRAADGVDQSVWATGERFGLEPVDETRADRVAFSGAWIPQSIAGAYGG